MRFLELVFDVDVEDAQRRQLVDEAAGDGPQETARRVEHELGELEAVQRLYSGLDGQQRAVFAELSAAGMFGDLWRSGALDGLGLPGGGP